MGRAALCALLAVVALPASGAAAPVCRDPKGDVRLTETGPVVDAAHLDLRYADLGVGAGLLTVRVGTYSMGTAGSEGVWKATFTIGKTRYWALASTAALPQPLAPETRKGFRGGVVGGTSAEGIGVFDATNREIRIHVPLYAFGSRAPRSVTKVTAFSVVAQQQVVSGPTGVTLIDRHTCVR